MLSDRDFIKLSLDINLFFLRILKEHAFFLEVSFPPKNYFLAEQAKMLKHTFDCLLIETIHLACGEVKIKDDAVTKYTLEAEKASAFLLGTPINTNITLEEMDMKKNNNTNPSHNPSHKMLAQKIYMLNCQALKAAKTIVNYKTMVLDHVLKCKLFTINYPLLIEHIRREAMFYIDLLTKLQNKEDNNTIQDTIKKEAFWNKIMAEHAKFIRGLLDPSEDNLIQTANNFGTQFDELTKEALKATEKTDPQLTKESLDLTKEFKSFKEQGTKGILGCDIKSIIIPLLADHVLREANHYLRLLKKVEKNS